MAAVRPIEFQIIEVGTGDILMVGGFAKPGGEWITHRMVTPLIEEVAEQNPKKAGLILG